MALFSFDRGRSGRWRVTAAEIVAAVLSAVWIIGVAAYLLVVGVDAAALAGPGVLVTLVAALLPLGLIWIGAAAARSGRMMREETRRLEEAIEAIRSSALAGQSAQAALRPSVEAKLEEIASAARQKATALSAFTSIRRSHDGTGAVPMPPPAEQGALALGAADAPAEPVPVADFLRALNFPDNEGDTEGFRALRRALHDRSTAQLITSAQTVLAGLAEEGILMDDLPPDRARPELWRRFAAGERGRAVAALGGIRDRSSLALTAGRMRSDPEFRAAGHMFLRRFDQMLLTFEPKATDAELAKLGDTRTARAFMLLGRVTGTFA